MSNLHNIDKDVSSLKQPADSQIAIDAKLDEFLNLLNTSDLDHEKAKVIRQRFNQALDNRLAAGTKPIEAFKNLEINDFASRAELLDEFSVLLSGHQLDSKMTKQYIRGEQLSKIFLIVIGVVMVALGFAMIIMPAPPYFEMFTIYYFSPDDGVTLMDLISLLIILSGIFLIVRSLYKKLSTTS